MDAASCICLLILPLAQMSYPQFDVWSVKEGNALAGGDGADDLALWVETVVRIQDFLTKDLNVNHRTGQL